MDRTTKIYIIGQWSFSLVHKNGPGFPLGLMRPPHGDPKTRKSVEVVPRPIGNWVSRSELRFGCRTLRTQAELNCVPRSPGVSPAGPVCPCANYREGK